MPKNMEFFCAIQHWLAQCVHFLTSIWVINKFITHECEKEKIQQYFDGLQIPDQEWVAVEALLSVFNICIRHDFLFSQDTIYRVEIFVSVYTLDISICDVRNGRKPSNSLLSTSRIYPNNYCPTCLQDWTQQDNPWDWTCDRRNDQRYWIISRWRSTLQCNHHCYSHTPTILSPVFHQIFPQSCWTFSDSVGENLWWRAGPYAKEAQYTVVNLTPNWTALNTWRHTSLTISVTYWVMNWSTHVLILQDILTQKNLHLKVLYLLPGGRYVSTPTFSFSYWFEVSWINFIQENHSAYPVVSRMSCDHLACTGTSCACERTFLLAGQIATANLILAPQKIERAFGYQSLRIICRGFCWGPKGQIEEIFRAIQEDIILYS